MTDITHEKWVIACAAWCNVTPEHMESTKDRMPEGSRQGWSRVYDAIMAHAKAEERERCARLMDSFHTTEHDHAAYEIRNMDKEG